MSLALARPIPVEGPRAGDMATVPAAPRRLAWLRAVLVAAVVLPAATMAVIAWIGWRDAWDNAQRELSRSAEAGAEYMLRVTEGHRLLGDLVNDLLIGLDATTIRDREAALHRSVAALLPRFPLARTIVVMSADGALLLMATVHPVPRDASFADREWMVVLRDGDAPDLHISRVMTGRLDGGLFYAVSRRREMRGPDTGGVISVSVAPDGIAAGFRAVTGDDGDVTALIRTDGEMLVRTPFFAPDLPRIPDDSPLRVAAARGEARGTYLGRTLGLTAERRGHGRLIAFRRVGALPLYVTVGRPTPLIVARWRQTVMRQLAIGVPTTLAMVGLAWVALRRARAAEAAEAALRQAAAAHAVAEARRDAEARFRGVFESRVVGMAVFDTGTGETLLANDRLLEMTGCSRTAFDAGLWDWRAATPPDDLPRDDAAIAEARQRGWWEPYEKEYLLPDGCRLPVRISSAPLPGEPGRLVVLVEDITERREAELRRELLIREVDHRAKNALATARAALRLTRAPDLDAFVREVDGRIGALAKAIALLAGTRWAGVPLQSLLTGELAGFAAQEAGGEGPWVTLHGPAVTLSAVAVQPLAMAIHELATNAAKYGALSQPGGRVAITWSIRDGAPAMLALQWRESGGPPIASSPAGDGFGTRVLQATLTRQLAGEVRQHWHPAGLICDILLPAARVLAAEPAPAAA